MDNTPSDETSGYTMGMKPTRLEVLRGLGLGLVAGPVLDVAAPAKGAASCVDRGVKIISKARRIVNPEGIELLETVRIGGIEQWVSVRGADRRNPVLLFIHGGPGYVSIPMSWWWHGWEDYFTVVQWDQRGAGKTYLINDPVSVGPTLTFERMIADALEMVNWARRILRKKKVTVLGHSWGSYLGLELATRYPEMLDAYLGVGQLTNGPESERRGWKFAMRQAQRAGNTRAIRELQSIAPYFARAKVPTLEQIYTQRRWLDYYGGVMAFRRGNDDESDLAALSPDYTEVERTHIWDGNEFSEAHLLPEVLATDRSSVRTVRCPLVIFAGRHDVNVNSDVAAEWFAEVDAPAKHFVWFEKSAHLPMTEEPGTFTVSLVRYVRPFAESS